MTDAPLSISDLTHIYDGLLAERRKAMTSRNPAYIAQVGQQLFECYAQLRLAGAGEQLLQELIERASLEQIGELDVELAFAMPDHMAGTYPVRKQWTYRTYALDRAVEFAVFQTQQGYRLASLDGTFWLETFASREEAVEHAKKFFFLMLWWCKLAGLPLDAWTPDVYYREATGAVWTSEQGNSYTVPDAPNLMREEDA